MNRPTRAFIVSACVLLALEIGARSVPDAWLVHHTETGVTSEAATAMLPDANRIFRFAPGRVFMAETPATADADGLRISAVEGPANAPLILTLGDSSVFGHGVADGQTLHDRLQEELTRTGQPVRVRCGGTPGYSTVQSLALLQEVGWALKPALLVVANLWSDSRLDRYRDREVLGRIGWTDHVALLRLLRWGIQTARGGPTATQVAWPTPSDAGIRRVPLPEYRDNLDTILREARSRDVGVLVLGLTHASWVAAGKAEGGTAAPYLAVLRSVAEAHDVPYVDGTDTFVRAQTKEPLFSDNLHPTGAGHALLARAVTDALHHAGWPRRDLVPLGGSTRGPLPDDPSDGTTVAPDDSLRRSLDRTATEPRSTAVGLGPPPAAAE
jgi:hypothetical protein